MANDPVTQKDSDGASIARSDYGAALLASYLGWMLDAFDFFLVIFCLTAIAEEFHKSDAEIALSITVTLAFRPVGAFIFGLLADRYGRRVPLMIDLIFYSVMEVLTGLAPNYATFLIARALFGVGLGGEWGVGASLAMEKVPARRRGLLSGILQQGYAAGNLLAALCYFFLFDRYGWRPLFFLGGVPALLAVFVRFRITESEVWVRARKHTWRDLLLELKSHWKLFIYFLAFTTAMNLAGHGTLDMYPTFLQRYWHLGPHDRSAITGLSMIAAIAGGAIIGYSSDKWGRRPALVVALMMGILATPLWAYAPSLPLVILGACSMQFFIQGAWGVMPAHLTELSPSSVRASLPGLSYQCGALLSSFVVYAEAAFAKKIGYSHAMALTAALTVSFACLIAALGGRGGLHESLSISQKNFDMGHS